MRKIIFFGLLNMVCYTGFGQSINHRFFNSSELKEVVFVIPPMDDQQMDLKEYKVFIAKYWKIDIPYQIMDLEKAHEYTKNNKGVFIGGFLKVGARSGGNFGFQFRIYEANGFANTVVKIHLKKEIKRDDIAYALIQTQFLLREGSQFKPRNWIVGASGKLYGRQLKEKTLLIPEESLVYSNSEEYNVTEEKIRSYYPYKFKICSEDEISNAILSQAENYIIPVNIRRHASMEDIHSNDFQNFVILYQPSDGAVAGFTTSLYGGKMSFNRIKKFAEK